MLEDIVIDTNVLMHSSISSEPRQHDSYLLLRKLLASKTFLVVDEGFNIDSALNRSIIGHEYIKYLRSGTVGFSVVAKLASTKRLRLVPRMAPIREHNIIKQLIRDRQDRTFLSVSYNSTERLLVSHDFMDFQDTKRTEIRRNLGVGVITASESLPRL